MGKKNIIKFMFLKNWRCFFSFNIPKEGFQNYSICWLDLVLCTNNFVCNGINFQNAVLIRWWKFECFQLRSLEILAGRHIRRKDLDWSFKRFVSCSILFVFTQNFKSFDSFLKCCLNILSYLFLNLSKEKRSLLLAR